MIGKASSNREAAVNPLTSYSRLQSPGSSQMLPYLTEQREGTHPGQELPDQQGHYGWEKTQDPEMQVFLYTMTSLRDMQIRRWRGAIEVSSHNPGLSEDIFSVLGTICAWCALVGNRNDEGQRALKAGRSKLAFLCARSWLEVSSQTIVNERSRKDLHFLLSPARIDEGL